MENTQNIKVEIGILKSAEEVFAAIVNPEKMTNYFISSSSGPSGCEKTLISSKKYYLTKQ